MGVLNVLMQPLVGGEQVCHLSSSRCILNRVPLRPPPRQPRETEKLPLPSPWYISLRPKKVHLSTGEINPHIETIGSGDFPPRLQQGLVSLWPLESPFQEQGAEVRRKRPQPQPHSAPQEVSFWLRTLPVIVSYTRNGWGLPLPRGQSVQHSAVGGVSSSRSRGRNSGHCPEWGPARWRRSCLFSLLFSSWVS